MNSPLRIASLLALLLSALTSASLAQETASPKSSESSEVSQPPQPLNAGFEQGELGEPPVDWGFNTRVGATVVLVADASVEGERVAFVDASTETVADRVWTNLMQSFDATEWRGKRVRYRAAVKVAGLVGEGGAQMWFRVDRPSDANGNRQLGSFDNMGDRPIRSAEWQHYEIVLDVAADATDLVFGVFLQRYGKVWVDDVSFEAVEKTVAVTPAGSTRNESGSASGGSAASGGSGASGASGESGGSNKPAAARGRPPRPESLQRALAEAEGAPQQSFWTRWLLLPAFAIVLFVIGMWPSRLRRPELEDFVDADAAPGSTPIGFVRRFALFFTVGYWLLYFLPRLLRTLAGGVDWVMRQISESPRASWSAWVHARLVEVDAWTADQLAGSVFGVEGELVRPNGSGDTTHNYVLMFGHFAIALVAALVLTLIFRRLKARTHSMQTDLLRSFLRYAIAAIVIGYGIAKLGITRNQFSELEDYHLNRTWGDTSPMGVVWSFMGSSRAYTMFSGGAEVLCGLLLIWRRTATLGGFVTIAVMTNVVLLNFCYDVPVKLLSTHLLLGAALVVVPDLPRMLKVFLWNQPTERFEPVTLWQNRSLWWLGLVGKLAMIGVCAALPLWHYSTRLKQDLDEISAAAEASEAGAADSGDAKPGNAGDGKKEPQHRLTKRGFRWINEVPFHR